jgi:hypothetical protein
MSADETGETVPRRLLYGLLAWAEELEWTWKLLSCVVADSGTALEEYELADDRPPGEQ